MTRWIRLRWPSDHLRDPKAAAAQAGLRARERNGIWELTTEAEYSRRLPRLLTLDQVIGPSSPPDDRTRQIIGQWEPLDIRGRGFTDQVRDHIKEMLHLEADDSPTIAEYMEAHRLLFLLLPDEDVFDWMHGVNQGLGDSFSNHRIALLGYSHEIHARMALVRALFTMAHAPERIAPNQTFEGFNSMRGLSGDAFQANSTFLNPLLAARAPWMIGAPLIRPPSAIAIALFDRPILGRPSAKYSSLSEVMTPSYLATPRTIRIPATPRIDLQDVLETLRWWIQGVNKLMSLALDPTLYANPSGWYDPALHLGYLISIDRLLASSIALLVHTDIDEYSRRLHLFEVLDLLAGLRIGDYNVTLNPDRTAVYLAELKEALPDPARRILLPRCEAAQAGLEDLWSGFHHGRKVDGGLRVANKRGHEELISAGNAASRYMRSVRNAGHSLTKELAKPEALSLLAAHEGQIDSAVSDIAFLHLVRLIAKPELLSRPRVR